MGGTGGGEGGISVAFVDKRLSWRKKEYNNSNNNRNQFMRCTRLGYHSRDETFAETTLHTEETCTLPGGMVHTMVA